MWSPTHVQVTVQRARDLLVKGKNGTNDVFVTIALGKVKYQTSVKEKASGVVEWHEQCELIIPDNANTSSILLTALHRNFLGVDEFLGTCKIPLADFDVYERPRNKWYTLASKPGKENTKSRGELEVKVSFQVRAEKVTRLSKSEKHKLSLGHLSEMTHAVGGSLLSIGSADKRRSIKSFAKSLGEKVKLNKDKKSEKELETYNPRLERPPVSKQVAGDADPGVISDGESGEDEFTFDDLSHKGSASSLSLSTNTTAVASTSLENLAGGEFLRRTSVVPTPPVKAPSKPPRSVATTETKTQDEWEEKLFGKQGKTGTLEREIKKANSEIELPELENKSKDIIEEPVKEKEEVKTNIFTRKIKNLKKDTKQAELIAENNKTMERYERIIIGGESVSTVPNEVLMKFEGKSKEELVQMVCDLQDVIENQNKRMKDMEDYLDQLLLRVMETTPKILQNPYASKISFRG